MGTTLELAEMAPPKRRRGTPAEGSKAPVVVPVTDNAPVVSEELSDEPEELMCPITRTMFRDPALVIDSGQTYERRAIRSHVRQSRSGGVNRRVVDPVTRTPLFDTRTVVNWVARKCVEAWLQRNPGRTPEGWDDRELPPPGGYKGIRPEDMAVLRALKTTWDKKDWVWPVKDGRNWDEPDRWNGVVFEDGHVMELLFTENDVAGGVPKVIGKLTAMETLNLSHNAISSVPREIGTCAALKQLELTGNELKLLPKEIGGLKSLKTLLIHENKLASLPDTIGNLTQLEELDASWNDITVLPASIGKLAENLKCLNLQGNKLTTLPKECGNLKSLEFLNLAQNKIKTLPAELGQLESIDELDLSDNKQLKTLPESLLLLKWEGANVIIDDRVDIGCHPNDFEVLNALRTHFPSLTKAWPESKPPKDWKGVKIVCGDVDFLTLKKMKLTGEVPAIIGKLAAVRHIDLSDNDITSLPAEVGNLLSLDHLCLTNNPRLKKIPGVIKEMCITCPHDKGVRFQAPRFKVGQRVECFCLVVGTGESKWIQGTVRQHYWRDCTWPRGQLVPYQVELDTSIAGDCPQGKKIFAPHDDDKCIRSLATAAKAKKKEKEKETATTANANSDESPQMAIPLADAHDHAADGGEEAEEMANIGMPRHFSPPPPGSFPFPGGFFFGGGNMGHRGEGLG